MIIVIGLNCLLAALVFGLTCLFWRWRCAVVMLNHQLQRHQPNTSQASGKMGYALIHNRTQIAQMRLTVAQWQMRSHQLKQTLQMLQILRTVLRYRTGRIGRNGQRRAHRRLK